MTKIRTWIAEIQSSFYSPQWYAQVPKMPLGRCIALLARVYTLWALIFSALFLTFAIPVALTFSRENPVEKHFPSDFAITIEKGIATSSSVQPYIIPLAEDEKKHSEQLDNLLVMDLRPDVTVAELGMHRALMLITRNQFITNPGDGTQGRVMSFSSFEDFTLDKQIALGWYEKIAAWFWPAVIIGGILFFLLTIGASLLGTLIASLVGACIAWLVASVKGMKMTYGEGYKLALVATVPVVIISIPLGILLGTLMLPFHLDLLIFIVVLFANLRRSIEVSETSAPDSSAS